MVPLLASGQMYTSPLYISSLATANGNINAVFVGTTGNHVFCLNAGQ